MDGVGLTSERGGELGWLSVLHLKDTTALVCVVGGEGGVGTGGGGREKGAAFPGGAPPTGVKRIKACPPFDPEIRPQRCALRTMTRGISESVDSGMCFSASLATLKNKTKTLCVQQQETAVLDCTPTTPGKYHCSF